MRDIFSRTGLQRSLVVGTLLAMTFASADAFAQRGGLGGGGLGGGGKGGGSTGGSTSGGGTSSGGGGSTSGQADIRGELKEEGDFGSQKWWGVGVGWETHALFWQNNTNNGANKVFNYGSAFAEATFLKRNSISVNFGFYERFLADQGESGVRLDDVTLLYIHTIPLPRKFSLSLRATLAFPTSFESQKISSIIAMTAAAQVSWKPVKGLDLNYRLSGTGYIDRYSVAEGGGPNASGRFGMLFSVEYSLPILKSLKNPLSIGGSLYTAWYWYYDVSTAPSPEITTPPPSGDPTFHSQPQQQRYGGEVFVRFTFPSFYGIKSDLRLAVADGDSALGFNGLLHDGVAHTYLSFYQTGEFYAALSLRY